MAQQTFTVQGMTCDHCVRAVTEAVAELPGAEAVAVDLATGTVWVEGPRPIDRTAVEAAVEEAGYALVAGPP
jgi:copper ion binding protein